MVTSLSFRWKLGILKPFSNSFAYSTGEDLFYSPFPGILSLLANGYDNDQTKVIDISVP